MYSKITDTLITTSEAALLQDELRILQQTLFSKREGGFNVALQTLVRARTSQLIESALAELKEGPAAFLDTLSKEIEQVPVIELGLAFEPTEDFLIKLHRHLKTEERPSFLLKITHLPHLIGGATVTVNGTYRDASLQHRLEQLFESITSVEELRKQLKLK